MLSRNFRFVFILSALLIYQACKVKTPQAPSANKKSLSSKSNNEQQGLNLDDQRILAIPKSLNELTMSSNRANYYDLTCPVDSKPKKIGVHFLELNNNLVDFFIYQNANQSIIAVANGEKTQGEKRQFIYLSEKPVEGTLKLKACLEAASSSSKEIECKNFDLPQKTQTSAPDPYPEKAAIVTTLIQMEKESQSIYAQCQNYLTAVKNLLAETELRIKKAMPSNSLAFLWKII